MNEIVNPFELINAKLSSIHDKLERLDEKIVEPKPAALPQEKLLTTKEVCRRLSISRVTVWSWEKKNILHPIRIGNMKRYKETDIEAIGKRKRNHG